MLQYIMSTKTTSGYNKVITIKNKLLEEITMIKIYELFAGLGSPRKALHNKLGGGGYQSLGYSEIDKHAIAAYCAIHDDTPDNNDGDICLIKELPKDIDILFHGSPCQDFSVAGLSKGGEFDSNTRSSLMWETVRLVEGSMPKCVVWENVKGVLHKKHRPQFDKYLEKMSQLGYSNQYKILNSLDFGIPQRRGRVFVVSILGGTYDTK